jgi:vacuolar protein sorting-associated protein 13A/C
LKKGGEGGEKKMLEDQVANLLQKYLGNYVRGLNKEALKISVWQG